MRIFDTDKWDQVKLLKGHSKPIVRLVAYEVRHPWMNLFQHLLQYSSYMWYIQILGNPHLVSAAEDGYYYVWDLSIFAAASDKSAPLKYKVGRRIPAVHSCVIVVINGLNAADATPLTCAAAQRPARNFLESDRSSSPQRRRRQVLLSVLL